MLGLQGFFCFVLFVKWVKLFRWLLRSSQRVISQEYYGFLPILKRKIKATGFKRLMLSQTSSWSFFLSLSFFGGEGGGCWRNASPILLIGKSAKCAPLHPNFESHNIKLLLLFLLWLSDYVWFLLKSIKT